jgi:hypothetical protein
LADGSRRDTLSCVDAKEMMMAKAYWVATYRSISDPEA